MAKFSFRDFISSATQAYTGHLAGAVQAEQELRQRREEQRVREEEYDKTVQALVPRMGKDGQEKALSWLTRRAHNRSLGRPSDFVDPLDQIGEGGRTTFPGIPSMSAAAPAPTAPPLPPIPPVMTPGAASPLPKPIPPARVPPAAPVAPGPLPLAPRAMPTTPPVPGGRARPSAAGRAAAAARTLPADVPPVSEMPAQPGARMAPGRLVTPPLPEASPTAPADVMTPQEISAMPLSGAQPVPYQAPAPVAPELPTAPAIPLPPAEPKIRRRAVEIPTLGKVYLRGIDDADAKAMATAIRDAQRFVQSLPGLDDAAKLQFGIAIGNLPASYEDEEEYARGQQFLQMVAPYRPGGSISVKKAEDTQGEKALSRYEKAIEKIDDAPAGVLIERFPALLKEGKRLGREDLAPYAGDIGEIERRYAAGDVAGAERAARRLQGRFKAGLSPAEEAAAERAAWKAAAQLELTDPAAIRAEFQKRGVGAVIADVPEATLRARGREEAQKELRKEYDQQFRVAQGWRASSPPTEAAVKETVGRLLRLGNKLGVADAFPRELLREMDQAIRTRAVKALRDEQRAAAREQRAEEGLELRRQGAERAAAKRKAAIADVWKYMTREEKSEYTSLNRPGWGPEPQPAGLPPVYDEAEMSPEWVAQRKKSRARQNEIIRAAKKRQQETGGATAPPPGRTRPGALKSLRSRVDLGGLTPTARARVSDLDAYLSQRGMKGIITSALREGGPPSQHHDGNATDFVIPGADMAAVARDLRAQGFDAVYEPKGHVNPNGSVSTGAHIHVQFARAAAQATRTTQPRVTERPTPKAKVAPGAVKARPVRAMKTEDLLREALGAK